MMQHGQEDQARGGERTALLGKPNKRLAVHSFTALGLCLVTLCVGRRSTSCWGMFEDNPSKKVISSRETTGMCQHLNEIVAAYTHAMKEDPEHAALATSWDFVNTTTTTPYLPLMPFNTDLLDLAFGGRRVALIGDSTLFYTVRWLDAMMWNVSESSRATVNNLSQQPNLTQAVQTMYDYYGLGMLMGQMGRFKFETNSTTATTNNQSSLGDNPPTDNSSINTTTSSTTQIQFHGFNGINMGGNCNFDKHVWPAVTKQQPEIIVANWGLHMFYRSRGVKLCHAAQWVHFEDFFLQPVVDHARRAKTKVLLFKTTNRACHGDETKVYQAEQPKCLQQNQTLVQEQDKYNITSADLEDYCQHGLLMVEHSVQMLNDRVRRFVETTKAQQAPDDPLVIDIFNDHDYISCQYTEPRDGRHYHPLQLARIRLLATMVHCLWQ